MIIMGAGICQWFHGDATYRAILSLLILTGCMGRNGGGWAHYVGQEKCRPITGWISLANALDWSRPPRTMIGTAYWYMHTDQWRNDGYSGRRARLAAGRGAPRPACTPPTRSRSRRGWAGCRSTRSSTATRSTSPTRPTAAVDAGEAAGRRRRTSRTRSQDGSLQPAIEDVDAPENWPRTLVLWRSNLIGSSAKGNEYFLQAPARHPLATCSATENRRGAAADATSTWRDEAPEGKLDLLVSRRLPDDLDHAALRRRAARRPPGTRSTTCPPPTCTRSCTPSPRRSTRRGRPRATSRPST